MLTLRKRGKSLRAIQTTLASKGHKLSVQGVAKLLAAAAEQTASQSH